MFHADGEARGKCHIDDAIAVRVAVLDSLQALSTVLGDCEVESEDRLHRGVSLLCGVKVLGLKAVAVGGASSRTAFGLGASA